MNRFGAAAVAAYIATIFFANYLTERFGFVDAGFGYTVTAGTFAAGAALLFRDVVQDYLGRWWVLAGIAGGALLTLTTAPALAVASAGAFLIAELLDMAIYTPLRKKSWSGAVVVSNTLGALVDTIVFLHLAGFPLTRVAVEGQMLGKVLYATLIPVVLVVVLRKSFKRANI